MDLSENNFKTPTRQENPSSTSTRQSPCPMSTPNNANSAPAPLLRPLGNGCFVLPDRFRPNVTLLLTFDQISLYLQHDAELRGGAAPRSIPSPVGYDEFAVALSTNTGNEIRVAFIPEGEASVRITGRPPALAELVGLEATQRTLPASRDPREVAGGKWLDPHRSKLMEEVLWDNLERIRKQRQWRERGVSERQAKKRKREDEKVVKPFVPSVAVTNAIAGPSSSSNPVPAFHSTPLHHPRATAASRGHGRSPQKR
ncbi:hypothetical protein BDR03DRAFT_947106 [Suillus americanus]|nr:hypothetical protein BDR03DRAFT_947106 [Suillus americanus]